MSASAEVFDRERGRLFGLAYRMLGSVVDADDVVQDAWLRWDGVDGATVERPEAFLTTVTTRLAIDRLRAARRSRETYVGPWLPEPVRTDEDPARIVEVDESVTLGFLSVLERLGPVDRAVFLLRDVFDVGYAEIATIVDRSEANCRQIAHRARERVRRDRPRFDVEPDRRDDLLRAFALALASGDATRLETMLAEDAVHVSDGGATVHAARRPVRGRERVARLLANIARRTAGWNPDVEPVEVNGQGALLVRIRGRAVLVLEVEFADGLVQRVHGMLNPEKLAYVAARSMPPASKSTPTSSTQ